LFASSGISVIAVTNAASFHVGIAVLGTALAGRIMSSRGRSSRGCGFERVWRQFLAVKYRNIYYNSKQHRKALAVAAWAALLRRAKDALKRPRI